MTLFCRSTWIGPDISTYPDLFQRSFVPLSTDRIHEAHNLVDSDGVEKRKHVAPVHLNALRSVG